MRFPGDVALIVIDVQRAIDDPKWGPRCNLSAEARIAELLGVWREQRLPLFHVRHDSEAVRSPYRPGGPGHAFKDEAAPLPGETIVGKRSPSAFADTALEAALEAIGATTLVLCGTLTHNSVEATARHASALGFRVFVVEDATWAVDVRDWSGQLRPAAEVHALSLANLNGEYAVIATAAATIIAARNARARERMRAAKPSP